MKACTTIASALDDVALGAHPSHALATHLKTCPACAAQLERKRAIAERIDRGIVTAVRAELPPGVAERIAARTSFRRPQRRRFVWLGVPAAMAFACAILIFVSLVDNRRTSLHPTDVGAFTAWHSPTASLLISRGNVLRTPLRLPNLRRASGQFRS